MMRLKIKHMDHWKRIDQKDPTTCVNISLTKTPKVTQWGKDNLFNKWC